MSGLDFLNQSESSRGRDCAKLIRADKIEPVENVVVGHFANTVYHYSLIVTEGATTSTTTFSGLL